MSSHKHRKTKAKKEPVPVHGTVLSGNSSTNMDAMGMWQRRMSLMNQVRGMDIPFLLQGWLISCLFLTGHNVS